MHSPTCPKQLPPAQRPARISLASPKAFAVLNYLLGRPGQLVTKKELLDTVWPAPCARGCRPARRSSCG
ncbi:MAG: hypothetical protein DMG07_01320 [Acidobacteria bacterium]|nr:MAG: hypothetical protein DMG07_01320 [Acidobacteriota bacterium]